MQPRARLTTGLIALSCLAAAGCAKVADEAANGAPTVEEVSVLSEPAVAAELSVAVAAGTATPAPAAEVEPVANRDAIDHQPAAIEVAVTLPAASEDPPVAALEPELPVAAAAVPAPQEPAFETDLPASPAEVSLAAETLDLSALLTRLRKTDAINLRTKLAVKNESDDLLERFRVYHAQHGTTTITELQRSYDSLFVKLHSLLEDGDPPLARDIDRSRAAIWAMLVDPAKFGA